jgi:CRP/FNR family transcriptional regulator, cyclic AMP receptor protein
MAGINILANERETRSLEPGDVLFREGDVGDEMFAVVEGRVELTRAGEILELVGPGGIVGEMALIDDAPRSATATVVAPTRVARVDGKRFTFLVQEHPTFALQVMKVMAERLRATTKGPAA